MEFSAGIEIEFEYELLSTDTLKLPVVLTNNGEDKSLHFIDND